MPRGSSTGPPHRWPWPVFAAVVFEVAAYMIYRSLMAMGVFGWPAGAVAVGAVKPRDAPIYRGGLLG
ncbi:hypothetical protein BRAS3809_3370011 [Bradyrhizobium sp. STM 3809]|nr:hypothetical protein BRAS3809_3370011 [Bradyrhizobium sp. STM 3809]